MPSTSNLRPGLRASVTRTVTPEMTASRVGSGDVDVLATPIVLALVEAAAVAAVEGSLPDDETSVGASVALDHLAPTPVGAQVTATARLEEVQGRRLSFAFEVTDPAGMVARGDHLRVVVGRASFEASAARRPGAG